MDEDVPSLLLSLLLMENCFNSLSNIDGEEQTHCISVLPPLSLVVRGVPPSIRHSTTFRFRLVLCWLGQDNGWSKMVILHELGATVLKRLRAWIQHNRVIEKRERAMSRLHTIKEPKHMSRETPLPIREVREGVRVDLGHGSWHQEETSQSSFYSGIPSPVTLIANTFDGVNHPSQASKIVIRRESTFISYQAIS